MLKKVKLNDCIPVVFVLCMILGDLFSIYYFQYFDEAMEVLSLLWLIYSLINHRNQDFFRVLFFLFLIGICGNFINKFKIGFIQKIEDFLLALKWPIVFLAIFDFYTHSNQNFSFKSMSKILYFVSCILSVMIFIYCFYKLRIGSNSVSFFKTGYTGSLAIYSFVFSFIIYSTNFECKRRKHINFLILLNFISSMLIQSTFSLALYTVFFIYVFYNNMIKDKVKGTSMLFLIGTIAFLIVFGFSYKKIVSYFYDSSAPRAIFLSNSFKLANMYFPFGVGLGLYGGSIAANNYSPVYTFLGFENMWVVSRGSNFLMDSFFPTIIGEFGYCGIILYLYLNYLCLKKVPRDKKNRLGQIIFIVFLLSGMTSNFLNSGVGMVMINSIILFYMIDKNKKNEGKIRKEWLAVEEAG